MPSWLEILLAILVGPALWLVGAIFFDFVHWVLHVMLRSRWSVLRTLAWPHVVHHEWIDRNLEVRWEVQRRNVWCHIVPEYVTQLIFSGAVWLVLPTPFIVVLVLLQTLVFVSILRVGGLDINHRPIAMLDAYRPGFYTPPAYHALHHVYPDAYYSAYTKGVDWFVAGGVQLRGRRFALRGMSTPFARALCAELSRVGVEEMQDFAAMDAAELANLDVLILCDPEETVVPAVEAFARATRTRKLPPEIWAVHEEPKDVTARHYHRDVRVNYRTILLRDAAGLGSEEARSAARTALSAIRRGFNFVPTRWTVQALRDLGRFRRTTPVRPAAAVAVRRRADLVAADASATGGD